MILPFPPLKAFTCLIFCPAEITEITHFIWFPITLSAKQSEMSAVFLPMALHQLMSDLIPPTSKPLLFQKLT